MGVCVCAVLRRRAVLVVMVKTPNRNNDPRAVSFSLSEELALPTKPIELDATCRWRGRSCSAHGRHSAVASQVESARVATCRMAGPLLQCMAATLRVASQSSRLESPLAEWRGRSCSAWPPLCEWRRKSALAEWRLDRCMAAASPARALQNGVAGRVGSSRHLHNRAMSNHEVGQLLSACVDAKPTVRTATYRSLRPLPTQAC